MTDQQIHDMRAAEGWRDARAIALADSEQQLAMAEEKLDELRQICDHKNPDGTEALQCYSTDEVAVLTCDLCDARTLIEPAE